MRSSPILAFKTVKITLKCCKMCVFGVFLMKYGLFYMKLGLFRVKYVISVVRV